MLGHESVDASHLSVHAVGEAREAHAFLRLRRVRRVDAHARLVGVRVRVRVRVRVSTRVCSRRESWLGLGLANPNPHPHPHPTPHLLEDGVVRALVAQILAQHRVAVLVRLGLGFGSALG